MKYKLLGNSGLRVSELCLGTMTFGTEWGWGADKETSRKMFNLYAEAGGNFIDTANFYTGGTSEEFLGEFMLHGRDKYVLATKFTLNMRPGDPNAGGNHRKNIMQSVEASLKRLKTDYIDLLWLHAWDFTTPEEEVMRALDDLVRQGKVHYLGISDTPAWIVARANTIAELRGWTQFIGLQIEYSLVERAVERELIPLARGLNLGVLAWSPLGGGLLSGKYRSAADFEKEDARLKADNRRNNDHNLKIVEALTSVADEIGCPPAQLALAWLLRKDDRVIPIVGSRKPEQLADNLGAVSVEISETQMRKLDDASAVELGFPHDFLNSDSVKEYIYGSKDMKISGLRK